MARQPVLLVPPTALGINSAAVYTAPSYVPTTQRTVIRHVHISNPAGSAVNFSMGLNGTVAGSQVFGSYSISASAVYDHYCQYPLSSGQTLQMWASGASVLVATVSGEENAG